VWEHNQKVNASLTHWQELFTNDGGYDKTKELKRKGVSEDMRVAKAGDSGKTEGLTEGTCKKLDEASLVRHENHIRKKCYYWKGETQSEECK
jgi:hypothetical protein